MSVDPGIELGLTVFVTSRRYRQTNSAQALKETDRFKRLNADPCGSIRVRVRVRVRVSVSVRVRARVRGRYFLRLHTPFPV